MFNSHIPKQSELIQKSSPIKLAEIGPEKRIIKVGFAIKVNESEEG